MFQATYPPDLNLTAAVKALAQGNVVAQLNHLPSVAARMAAGALGGTLNRFLPVETEDDYPATRPHGVALA